MKRKTAETSSPMMTETLNTHPSISAALFSASKKNEKKYKLGGQEKETIGTNVNYISVGMKRLKELSLPVVSLLNSLNQSQRRMALIAVAILFFWPLLILALNLPWILAVSSVLYAFYFGTGKFCSDANEAMMEHLDVNVEERGRAVQKKFQDSKFPGKETLIYCVLRLKELLIVAYKSALLLSMTLLDYLVTLLLNTARSAKQMATTTAASSSCPKA